MSRLFLILAIAALVYLLINSYRRNALRKNAEAKDRLAAEDMVRCEHCGVHLPKGESIQAQQKFFCDTKHRDAYLK